MHILHIPSWYPLNTEDFSGSFFRDQVSALHQAGFKVGVLAPMIKSFLPNVLIRPLRGRWIFSEEDGFPVVRVPMVNLFPRCGSATAWWLRKSLRAPYDEYIKIYGVPDLVHVQSLLPAGEFARELKEHRGIPYVVTEHSTAYARRLISGRRLVRAEKIARSASCRVAVSSPLVECMARATNTAERDWECVPNVVPKIFENWAMGPGLQEHKASNKTYTFLTVGTLARKKRFDLLLRAYASNYLTVDTVSLLICGDGPERKNLTRLAEKLGIKRQVRFEGYVSRKNIIEQFEKCEIFVLPSDYETFGVVLIEANAMGLPAIATASGGPEDIVRPWNGRLVSPGSVKELAEAMEAVRKNMVAFDAREVSKRCLEIFGRVSFASRMAEIYRRAKAVR